MTIQRAAQTALDVQDACNLSGVLATFHSIVMDVLWPEARLQGGGTEWVNTHPIVTMFLLKLCELNGCGSTLHESYTIAEAKCIAMAAKGVTVNDPA